MLSIIDGTTMTMDLVSYPKLPGHKVFEAVQSAC
jgi:hypothetical protein